MSFIYFDDSVYQDHVDGLQYLKHCNKKFKPTAYDLTYNTIIEDGDVWLIKTDYIEEFCKFASSFDGKINIVVQHSDIAFSKEIYKIIPKCVKTIFTINCNIKENNVVPIPLGLGPKFGRGAPNIVDIQDTAKNSNKNKLLYLNFRTNTFPQERIPVYTYFENLAKNNSWITIGNIDSNYDNYRTYLSDLTNHKFCICPRGNGIDTHRLWECLYSKTIPIVRYDDYAHYNFKDLPILFVDYWNDISIELLDRVWTHFTHTTWNFNKLKSNYWGSLFNEK